MKKALIALLLLAAAGAAYLYRESNQPPEATFTRVKRERLVSILATNGKAEPVETASARAERAGLLERVPVHVGQLVTRGQALAEFAAGEARSELTAAQSRLEQARAALALAEQGGRAVEQTEIDNALARSKVDLEEAVRVAESLSRLVAKQAASAAEAAAAKSKVDVLRVEMQSLERKRKALVGAADKSVATAQVRDAQAAIDLANQKLQQSVIRSPMEGVLYEYAVRPGTYLNPGDLVGRVGRTARMRVRVYVDEPELGRVAVGQPVTITWDALAGKATWQGAVERLPQAIEPLGSRQVGEVLCTIDNPRADLVPGANVNAEIRTSVAESALTIPKEALRRDAQQNGVFVLEAASGKLLWKPVTVGISSVTKAGIEGVEEGAAVLLPGEKVLKAGDVVRPVFP